MSGITPPLSTTYHYSAEADWLIPILIGALPIIITIIVIIVLACRVKKHAANPVHSCPQCGQMASTKDNFCKRCGFPLQSQAMPFHPQNNFYIQPASPLTPPKKRRTGIIVAIILLIIEVIAVVCSSLLLYFNYQNAFDTNITSEDYSFEYREQSDGVIVEIIPKYDISDFSFTIVYYGSGLLNSYEQEHSKALAKADDPLVYSMPYITLNDELSGDFRYADLVNVSGKKQNKYKNQSSASLDDPSLNTEMDFSFTLSQRYSSHYLSGQFTNNSNRPILELREFRVRIVFEYEVICNYYTPRLIFDSAILPGESSEFLSLSGNISLGGGGGNFTEVFDIKNPIMSVSYSNQTYTVIYE